MIEENYRLRFTDFAPWRGLIEYGERTGFYTKGQARSNIKGTSDKVLNRISILVTYTGLHTMLGTYLTLRCLENVVS